MLITTRMEGEDMIIIVPPSDKPTVIVHRTVEIRRDRVRQGYDAPREVSVNRREVQERINRELAAPAAV